MGLINWFNSLANSSAADAAFQPAPDAAPEETAVVGGIDFRNAIQIHAKWKSRLKNYIEGKSNEDLKVAVISRDDQCVLGKWLHNEGQAKYGNVKEFQQLIEMHREFTGSTVAAQVIDDWPNVLNRFVKVMPTDYKRVLQEMEVNS